MDNPCKQCHSGFCSAHHHPEHAVWEQITQEHAALGNQVAAFAAAIRNAALEEVAKHLESKKPDSPTAMVVQAFADEVRSLKSQ